LPVTANLQVPRFAMSRPCWSLAVAGRPFAMM
jgi:hypothetical protein